MKPDLDSFILEYASSSEPQIRKNALTVSALVASEKGINTLVDMAMTDEDDSVRQRAQKEIVGLHSKESVQLAISKIEKAIKDPDTRKPAYMLAGQLRFHRFPIYGSNLSFFEQIKLGSWVRQQLYAKRNWSFRFRALKPGLFGGFLGILIVFFLTLFFNSTNFGEVIFQGQELVSFWEEYALHLVIVGFIVSPVLSVIVTQYVAPTHIQVDPLMAVITELVIAFVWGSALGLVVFFLLFALDGSGQRLGLTVLSFGVFIAAIRGGTLIGSKNDGAYLKTRYLSVLLGTFFGMLSLSPALFMPELLSEVGNRFLFFLILCPAIANGFARIDEALAPRREGWGFQEKRWDFLQRKGGAISIVEEYLRADNPWLRNRAVTAFTYLEDPEGLDFVLDAALHDDKKKVREFSKTKLETLESSSAINYVRQRVKRILLDKKRQPEMYRLAGQLRSDGFEISGSSLPWWRKWWMASQMRNLLYPVRDWSFRTRFMDTIWIGSVIGPVLVLSFLFTTGIVTLKHIQLDASAIQVLVVGVPTAFFLSIVVGQYAVPIHLHLDRFIGAIIELFRSFVWGIIGGVVLFGIGIAINDENVALAGLGVPLLFPIVRAGTLIAYGAYEGKRLNQIIQTAVGSAWGFFYIALVSWLIISSFGGSITDTFFLTISPSCFAIAYLLSRVDGAKAPIEPLLGKTARLFSIFSIAGLAIPLLSSFFHFLVFPEFSPREEIVYELGQDSSFVAKMNDHDEIKILLSAPQAIELICENCSSEYTYSASLKDTLGNYLDYGLNKEHRPGTYLVEFENIHDRELPIECSILYRFGERASLGYLESPIPGSPSDPCSASLKVSSFSVAIADPLGQAKNRIAAVMGKLKPQRAEIRDVLNIIESLDQDEWQYLEISVEDWNNLCWFGSLQGFYGDPITITACDTAVSLSNDPAIKAAIVDSRGVNSALNNDLEGALSDFQFFVQDSLAFSTSDEDRLLRQEWIDAINEGRNPITTEVVMKLLEGEQ